jgi:hypothetical protein
MHGVHRLVIERKDAQRIRMHAVARFGQHHPAPLLAEQRLSQLRLQLAHLLADSRLRATHALRGAGQAAQVKDRGQGAQRIHVEIGELHVEEFLILIGGDAWLAG